MKICRLGSYKSRISFLYIIYVENLLNWVDLIVCLGVTILVLRWVGWIIGGKVGLVEVLNIFGVGLDVLNNVCLVKDR